MTPQQILALLLEIADLRLQRDQLLQQLRQLEQRMAEPKDESWA